MKAKELRKFARADLEGKWLRGVAISFVFVVLVFFIAFALTVFESSIIAPIAIALYIAIVPPLSFSIMAQFLRLQKGEHVGVLDFAEWTTSNFTKSWKVVLHMAKKVWVLFIIAIVCIVVAVSAMVSGVIGIIDETDISSTLLSFGLTSLGFIGYFVVLILLAMELYYYYLVPYIMEDEKELSPQEVVAKSAELMKGNRWRLICLALSFIGWIILSLFTFGIGYFFLLPYMQMSIVEFYLERSGNLKNTTE